MKQATGELSITVITLILIITVIGFWFILKNSLQNWTRDTLNNAQEQLQ